MVGIFYIMWAAVSLLALACLIFFFAKKKMNAVTFICLLIFLVLGSAGFLGLLNIGSQLG